MPSAASRSERIILSFVLLLAGKLLPKNSIRFSPGEQLSFRAIPAAKDSFLIWPRTAATTALGQSRHFGRRPITFAVGTRVTSRPPHRSVRAQFGHTACMGLSLSRRHHAISVVLCHSILLFDLRRKHSFVPTAYLHRRRAQRRSRTALLQRRRRLVLDGRERGGRLLASGWLARAMIRGEPAIGRDQSRKPRLYSVEPVWGADHEAVHTLLRARLRGGGSILPAALQP